MSEIESTLRGFVDACKVAGFRDVLKEFVLSRGVLMVGDRLPDGVRRGVARECFRNATELFVDAPDRYVYCEGFGTTPRLRQLPIHHAWCLDKLTGRVVDPTWKDPEACEYFGVAFDAETVLRETLALEVYGLLDTGVGPNAALMRRLAPELGIAP